MALKPELSLGVGLATAAVVWGVYQHYLPSVADHRMGPTGEPHADVAERQATWTAAAIVGGISLIARDPTVFIIGGIMVVTLAWTHRHANLIDGATGFAVAEVNPNVASVEGTTYGDYTPAVG